MGVKGQPWCGLLVAKEWPNGSLERSRGCLGVAKGRPRADLLVNKGKPRALGGQEVAQGS